MNIHPIIVHFPIALLSLYALMELIRWQRLLSQQYWFYVKAVFLFIGGLGALAAAATGDFAAEGVAQGHFTPAVSNFHQVVELHELFAHASIAIFGLLAIGYLITWLDRAHVGSYMAKYNLQRTWNILHRVSALLISSPFVILLALIGFVVITITGGLGGIMVFGPDSDPFFKIIYQTLFQ